MYRSIWTVILVLAFITTIGCISIESDSTFLKPAPPILKFDADQLLQDWVDMWNSYDLSQVDSLFLTDEHVTYFSSEKQGVIVGIDAVREHHVGFGFVPGGDQKYTKLWLDDIHTEIYTTTTVVTALWYFEKGPPDDRQTQLGPVTIVYIPTKIGYRIAHMNFAEYQPDDSH